MRRFRNVLFVFCVLPASLMLGGCPGFPTLSEPQIEAQTPQQEAYALQQNYDAFLSTVETLVDQGVLKDKRAGQVADIVTAAGVAYRSARDAILSNAPDKLQLVMGFQAALLRINPLIAGDEQ